MPIPNIHAQIYMDFSRKLVPYWHNYFWAASKNIKTDVCENTLKTSHIADNNITQSLNASAQVGLTIMEHEA